jgi:hypothetical protein
MTMLALAFPLFKQLRQVMRGREKPAARIAALNPEARP